MIYVLALLLYCVFSGLSHASSHLGKKTFHSIFDKVLLADTSLIALDPTLSCGLNSIVRLQAGIAQTYQWVRNGAAIPGATSRLYNANVSGNYRVRVTDGSGNLDSSRLIEVLIVPIPNVGFMINQVMQCLVGNSFSFINTTTINQGTATYKWYYGDGPNDDFIPFYINIRKLESFRIFNRWGVKVFETNDLSKSWNGIINGVRAPLDTYTWVVECYDVNGIKLTRKGMVTLIRY